MTVSYIVRKLGMAMVVALTAVGNLLGAEEEKSVRPAYCAGSWYPGNSAELATKVDELLDRASPPEISGKPIAVIAPHAGYRFSAPVAAHGYRCLKGHAYKRVIAIAFSHRNTGRYQGIAVQRGLTAYRTPLGDVPIDHDVVEPLWKKGDLFVWHPGIDRGEHSLELQLPFLQRVLRDFKLVPLLVGRMSTSDYAEAARAIAPWVDQDTLIAVSTDFTHFGANYGYEPFKEDVPARLRELGAKAAAPILACDFDGFAAHLAKTDDTICGRAPVQLLLRILSMQGGAKGVRTAFDTSGNMTDDWTNSVTYQSFVFTRRPGTLSDEARHELLRLARETATAYINGEKPPAVGADRLSADVRADGACFVTLQNHGALRGCIGNMEARGPLYQAVIHNAVEACRDYRFTNNPVTAEELNEIDVEISYLTPMKRVGDVNEIIIGRHGLLITLGRRRGVLLPQVAYERGWTREEFLRQVCRKAGLPPDAWKRSDAILQSCEAEVFGEREFAKTQPAGEH